MPLLCHAAHRVLRTPQPLEFNMNNICFHSILSSNQEVEFFTDMLLDTGIAGELDHSTLAELEDIPEEALLDEQAEALAEQFDIDSARH